MSIEDVNYMKENSIKQAYTFIVDSAERERDLYPNPNNYVVNFSTPYKNIIGMEIIDASIPRAMYTIDVDNNELYYYVGAETGDNLIDDGMQIYNTANLMLQNWNYTSNISSISSNISSSSNIISGYLASNITNDIKIINDISGIIYETTVITTNSNITDIYKILTSSNVITSSNIINNSNIFYTSNLYNTVKIYNTSNISKSSNISLTSRLLTASNILTTSNIFNFTNITNISRSSNISNLDLSGDRYAILNNSINLYNIYNNENNIGGYTEGITFNMCVLPIISSGGSASYNIMNFGYSHTYSLEADGDIIYRNVRVDVAKAANSSYTLSFTIGERTESVFNIIGSSASEEINIYWSILKTTWYIGIFDIDKRQLAYKEFYNCDQMYNVFYTKKYLGLGDSGGSSGSSGWGNNLLLFKDFKIYNVPMSYSMMAATPLSPIIWYKMDEVVNNEIINKGTSPIIEYKDIFKRLVIKGGDYTFKTFISKYDELRKNNDMELLFKETTAPPELTNLIDIYSKAPLIVDMKRSTLAENLGFDLYPTANNEDKYISKPYTTTESVLAKMFYSRSNATYDFDVSSENKYIITSPGIVYFIGNKYIIMRCPEIEEHLYRSLSYSKNTLGLAKFRVDSIGINSEKLTITKIPVREFHPIGKLSRMTLRFETNKGRLYDFKGLNHNIIFAIFYYEPVQKNIPKNSILNPEYKMNYLDYLYKQEEIEGDSDDDEGGGDGDEDFSRDNIDDYKIKENLYNKRGVELQQSNNYYQNNKMTNVIMENEDAEADEATDDYASEDANDADEANEYN
uniref:DUF5901 domain-containing protein n=1 Tax=viral metagenome TaxID=1070528 RepID=A0A6C0K735_9ZZZZ